MRFPPAAHRALGVAVLAVVLAGCLPPPVRGGPIRRVLLIGDSFSWGTTRWEGYPSIENDLRPLLAARGVELRMLGEAGSQPGPQRWVQQVSQVVKAWDPDLVILESVIPEDGVDGPNRGSVATTWAGLGYVAAQQGADVWRVVPPDPPPGTFISALWGSLLPAVRDAQEQGMAYGARNRPVTLDVGSWLAQCGGDLRTADGGHLNAAGQRCVAGRIADMVAPPPPTTTTTVPPDTTTTTAA